MDQEHIIDSFGEIEKQIDMLIGVCNQQDDKIKSLQGRINELEASLQEKANLEARFASEKEMVKNKIDGLINKLEDFVTQPR